MIFSHEYTRMNTNEKFENKNKGGVSGLILGFLLSFVSLSVNSAKQSDTRSF